jgi:hypothetical protein
MPTVFSFLFLGWTAFCLDTLCLSPLSQRPRPVRRDYHSSITLKKILEMVPPLFLSAGITTRPFSHNARNLASSSRDSSKISNIT